MLKHLRNVSDEQVVAQFTENAYFSTSAEWNPLALLLRVQPLNLFIFVTV